MQILQSLNPFDLERLEDGNIRALTGEFEVHLAIWPPFYLSLSLVFSSFQGAAGIACITNPVIGNIDRDQTKTLTCSLFQNFLRYRRIVLEY
jgi:hypothetical protein